MKRYGNIYPKLYTMDNLKLAHKRAKKDKSYYTEVKMIDNNEEFYLKQIQDMLKNKTYSVEQSDYKMFEKEDKGKIRQIFKLDYFPHRVIQHALLIQIEGILFKNLIDNTFSSLPTRGVHKAFKKLDYDLKQFEEKTTYCLQMDVKKFYPSINHKVNKKQYRRKFKDDDLLWLIDMLIDSLTLDDEGKIIDADKLNMVDDAIGIAIGALFSQWDGNFHLSELDHWLKEVKGARFYYRYCDDLIILSDSKEELHRLRKDIQDYLENVLKLTMKDNYKVFPVNKQGIDFVGYRHFRSYILLRKSTSKNLIRKMRDIQIKIDKGLHFTYSDYCSINSYKGWLEIADCYNLYNKWVKPMESYVEQYHKRAISNGYEGGIVMHKLSDFKEESDIMVGDSIKIGDAIGKDIEVYGYKIGVSKYDSDDTCLTIQLKLDGVDRVIFTGSNVLIDQCERYKSQMPFETVINKVGKYFIFA